MFFFNDNWLYYFARSSWFFSRRNTRRSLFFSSWVAKNACNFCNHFGSALNRANLVSAFGTAGVASLVTRDILSTITLLSSWAMSNKEQVKLLSWHSISLHRHTNNFSRDDLFIELFIIELETYQPGSCFDHLLFYREIDWKNKWFDKPYSFDIRVFFMIDVYFFEMEVTHKLMSSLDDLIGGDNISITVLYSWFQDDKGNGFVVLIFGENSLLVHSW